MKSVISCVFVDRLYYLPLLLEQFFSYDYRVRQLKIASAIRVATITVQLDGISRSFTRGAAILSVIGLRATARRVFTSISLV
jgi:hypothetical protein